MLLGVADKGGPETVTVCGTRGEEGGGGVGRHGEEVGGFLFFIFIFFFIWAADGVDVREVVVPAVASGKRPLQSVETLLLSLLLKLFSLLCLYIAAVGLSGLATVPGFSLVETACGGPRMAVQLG